MTLIKINFVVKSLVFTDCLFIDITKCIMDCVECNLTSLRKKKTNKTCSVQFHYSYNTLLLHLSSFRLLRLFVYNLIYDLYFKKYIEVDRELLLVKKQEQANFIAKCQNVGLFFGQLTYSRIWLEHDYEHFAFLVEKQYQTLIDLKLDVAKVFYFRDKEDRNNLFFQKHFSFFLGYLIGRILQLRICVSKHHEIKKINLQLESIEEDTLAYKFQLFDRFFAMRFSYNGIIFDKICKCKYQIFEMPKVKREIEIAVSDIIQNKSRSTTDTMDMTLNY